MADLETSAVTPTGVWDFTGGAATNLFFSAQTLNATATAQSTDTLTKHYNVIATATATALGVTLPAAATGKMVWVANKSANAINVWPATGDDLGKGANTAVSVATGQAGIFYAYGTDNWIGHAVTLIA